MAFIQEMHCNRTVASYGAHVRGGHVRHNSTSHRKHCGGKKGGQRLETTSPLNDDSSSVPADNGGQGGNNSKTGVFRFPLGFKFDQGNPLSDDDKSKSDPSSDHKDDPNQKADGHGSSDSDTSGNSKDDKGDDAKNYNKFGSPGGFGRLGFGKGFRGGTDANLTCDNVNETDGRLQYTGPWVLESKDPNGRVLTTHTTSDAGSQVNITFTGVSITVIGIVHESNNTVPPAVATYTIDDYPSVELPLPFIATNGNRTSIPNQQFFESSILPPGPHTLLINVTSDGSPYTLDGLRICSETGNPVAAAIAPTSTQSSASHLVQVIVVSVVGGLVFIVLMVALGIFFFHRRMRALRTKKTEASPVGGWLRQQGELQWTSSDSIMRHNPSNLSSADPDERAAKASRASSSYKSKRSSVSTAAGPGIGLGIVANPAYATRDGFEARRESDLRSVAPLIYDHSLPPEPYPTAPHQPPLPPKDILDMKLPPV